MKLNSIEQTVLTAYLHRLKVYRRTSVEIKELEEHERRSLSRAGQLADFYGFLIDEWIQAQFYWWHQWYKDAPEVINLGSRSTKDSRKDSLWRALEWRKVKDAGEEVNSQGPEETLPFDTIQQFIIDQVESDIAYGISVKDVLFSLVPSNIYFLISSKAVENDSRFLEEFKTIKEDYFEVYKDDPYLKFLNV